ncbi:MAG: asparagine synthase (glutamine-hydrolyzing) [Phycisphaerales bacterium]|nr:asparagine synthase (glutamine-hydrolyzing) [Phycisphaerales bacterium]
MCGIAGIMVRRGLAAPDTADLVCMAGALRHRGPDGYGVYADDRCGLAHARLAIIDLTGGHQPLCNEDGTVWITFNGEVFNYPELRTELEASGHIFRTRSDTEVIVHAYEQWGADTWRRLNGQFALAIRDTRDDSLTLVRDRVGIAPLFYAAGTDAVVFGSECKAVFASRRVPARVDPTSLGAVFTMWSVPGPCTVFEGVRCLLPGHAVRFGPDLRARDTAYSTLRIGRRDGAPNTLEVAADELASRLERAVHLRLRADVPVGAYLSGGLDSSLISRLVRRADSSPLQTFSVRFDDPRFDEGGAQRRMAVDLGTTHHEVIATPASVRDALPDAVFHAESPLLRTAPVPMFLLSSLVRGLGMRVVLTGEGADEFLGGYDLFKEDKVRRFWARQPGSTMRAALMSRVHRYVADAAQGSMWQEFFRTGLTETHHPHYSHRLRWENTAWTMRFLSGDVRAALNDDALNDRVAAALPEGWASASPLGRAQHLEIATFMTPYLLAAQGDRAIMAHGVEGRYPYLDPDVVEFCAGLPDRLKMSGLREKITLRAAARRSLPPEVAARRKWPYRAPIAGALFGPAAPDYARELLSSGAMSQNPLIDARPASRLAARAWQASRLGEREEMALVGLLTLQIWSRRFFGSMAAPGRYEQEPLVWVDRRTVAARAK